MFVARGITLLPTEIQGSFKLQVAAVGVESPRVRAQWSSWLHSAPGVVSFLYHGWEKGVTGIILRGFP